MKSFSYDFHIHSCLSPCGDDEMTPNNIVNLALLTECDVIAITDHNTCKNAPAVIEAGEKAGLLVLPGMELCTSEEAHVICLFESMEGAAAFDSYVYENMPHIPNKPDIFGEQRILNSEDEQIGTEENLLLVSSFISVNQVLALTGKYGGVAYPAHVNRDSYSVIASLGSIPPEAGFKAAEITYDCCLEELLKTNPELSGMRILRDSDSHYLETLAVAEPIRIHLPEKTRGGVIETLRKSVSL